VAYDNPLMLLLQSDDSPFSTMNYTDDIKGRVIVKMFISLERDGKSENLIETFQTKTLHFTMLRGS
jgi:hypothetical protein